MLRAMADSRSRSDQDLASAAAGGDAEAFGELYTRFASPIYTLAKRMTGDEDQALDLTQEIFQRSLASIRTFDRRRKFSSWLFKLATNRIIDHLKDRRRWRSMPAAGGDQEGADLPEQAAVLLEDLARIQATLEKIPEEYRIVLLLFFQQQLSYPEIAETLDISANLARVRMFRGLHSLRKELAP